MSAYPEGKHPRPQNRSGVLRPPTPLPVADSSLGADIPEAHGNVTSSNRTIVTILDQKDGLGSGNFLLASISEFFVVGVLLSFLVLLSKTAKKAVEKESHPAETIPPRLVRTKKITNLLTLFETSTEDSYGEKTSPRKRRPYSTTPTIRLRWKMLSLPLLQPCS